VVLVERDAGKRKTLLGNVAMVESRISVVIRPVEAYLSKAGEAFDIVFLDPPFAYPDKASLLRAVGEGGHVPEGGLVLIHLPREEAVEPAPAPLRQIDAREYGRSLVQFFRREAVTSEC
jgi:16S rRNA (guanine966-N2)-methyltransferase